MRTTYPELEPKVAKALANVALEYNATRLRPVFGEVTWDGITLADQSAGSTVLATVTLDAPLAGSYLTVEATTYLTLKQIDTAWLRFGVGFRLDSATWTPGGTNALSVMSTQAVVGATIAYFTLGYSRTHVLAQGRHTVELRWYKPDGHGVHADKAITGQTNYTLSLWVPTQTRL